MYKQTPKHEVWTSEQKKRNALKCGGILIQHDVTAKGLRAECESAHELKREDHVTEQSQ